MKELIENILEKKLGIRSKKMTLEKIQGQASAREYFRVSADHWNYVIMKLPPENTSEEKTTHQKTKSELPFINIARYLSKRKIPVGKIYHHDEEAGLLVLEDLGDVSFEEWIRNKKEVFVKNAYKNAIDLLIQFQSAGLSRNDECIAFSRQFTHDIFEWEFLHFLEYGIEERMNKKLTPSEMTTFKELFTPISIHLTSLPLYLVHRDYQSRNIMVQKNNLKLIDFQDALLGPQTYDLVALLRDSYVRLDDSVVIELLEYYFSKSPLELHSGTKEELLRNFDLMTIQRKLKDAGRFVFIDRVKKNPSFLPYISPSLKYVRTALERQQDFCGELKKKLSQFVPEFQ